MPTNLLRHAQADLRSSVLAAQLSTSIPFPACCLLQKLDDPLYRASLLHILVLVFHRSDSRSP